MAEGGAARGAGEQDQGGGHHDVLHGFVGCFFLRLLVVVGGWGKEVGLGMRAYKEM